MKTKIAPGLHRILYDGIKSYICKYTNINNNNKDEPNNNRNERFEEVQSKYRITDDDDETTRENRKRKELIKDVKPLIAMQQNIGWDNLLRGK